MPILIQILLYQSLFLLAYQLIKREPFFQLNRFYLLLSLAASFMLPFLEWSWFQFSVEQETFQKLNSVYLPEVVIGKDSASTTQMVQQQTSIDYISILENIYFLGFSIAFGLLYIKIEHVLQLIQEHISSTEKNFKIIYLKDCKEAFSFYNYVFVGNGICQNEQATVLAHEQEHVKLKHSLDNSFVAVLRVLMWFNPLLYYYQKELQLLHEYQADAKVCKKYNPKKYAWQLLNTAFETQNMSLMSSFYNTSFIKNRITMLQKRNKNSQSIFKYAIVTPILLMAFSFNLAAQSSLPEDEQALLEKYIDEIKSKKMESLLDYISGLRESNKKNEIPSKEDYYKGKAMMFVIFENSEEFEDLQDLIYTDYKTFLRNVEDGKVNLTKASEIDYKESYDSSVPMASVDRVPIYPGCDENLTDEELRKCLTEKIRLHINSNFKTSLASKLGIEGQTRIYVRFAIAKDGNIADVTARAAHPDLSDEGERVVNSLPKMKPGIHNEEAVSVIYTLPITLMVPEKKETKEGK